jgi:hypothetical protein
MTLTLHPQTEDAVLSAIDLFDEARAPLSPQARLDNVRQAARRLREQMLAEKPVPYYASFDLIRVPYPTRFALREACSVPLPFLHILNRMFVIQFESDDGLKTMLASPTDYRAARETPFFKRLSERFGPLRRLIEPIISREMGTVEGHLASLGLRPEQVDYITYDHLHTQDLRRWFGSRERPGYFPNARLLVTRQEWASAKALLPTQAEWYCPHGLDGVPDEKVMLLDRDVKLGTGVALIRTPGHTQGNHSIVVHTPEGLMVTSENGVSPDSYAPLHSRIPGVRKAARATGAEVILNGNTLEGALDQYISMVQEKEMAGPSSRNPDFYNTVPSSELTPYWLFPGIRPSFRFGSLRFGKLQRAAA